MNEPTSTDSKTNQPDPNGAPADGASVRLHGKNGGPDRGLLWVCLLALLSGAAALSYEVVWTRHLEFLFGVTQTAVSTTVASFMGGMALGSWLYGRLAMGATNPLAVYGLLEAAIGIYSLTVPELLISARGIYRILGMSPPGSVLTLWRLTASFVIMAPATVAMGATFPALVAAASHRPEKGRISALVYGTNTVGAVLGSLATGLVMFPLGGLVLPARMAATASIAAGLAALWLARRSGWSESSSAKKQTRKPKGESDRDRTDDRDEAADWRPALFTPQSLLLYAGLAAAFLGGAASLGAEVVWNRVLGLLLDGTVYGFSVLLGSYLAGIAIGSLAISWWLAKKSTDKASLLSWLHLAAALAALLFMATVSLLPEPLARIAASQPSAAQGFAIKAAIVAAMVLVPTVFFGAAFPVALELVAQSRSLGRAAAWTAASSTLGGIVGALGAGLWLPGLGVGSSRIALIAASLSLTAAVIVAWLDLTRTTWVQQRSMRSLGRPLALRLGLPVLLFGLAAAMGPKFHVARIAAARYAVEDYDHRLGIGPKPKGTLLFEAEGRQTIVTLRRTSQGGFRLRNNGLNEAYHSPAPPYFADVIYYLGALGYALQQQPQTALLVGLGSGGTAETILASNLRRVDVVEIEPKVVEASQIIYSMIHQGQSESASNGRQRQRPVIHPLADPRARLIIDDARNYLLRRAVTKKPRYDIIVSQPSHPWLSGMGTIYSREFFELVAANLTDRGLFCQWVNLFRMDSEALGSILSTFASVFAGFQVFFTDADSLVVVASKSPVRIDPAVIETHLQEDAFGSAADRQGLALAAFLAAHAFDRKRALALAHGADPITDMSPLLEMRLPWAFHGARVTPVSLLKKKHLAYGLLPDDLAPRARIPATWSRYAQAAVRSVKEGRLEPQTAYAIIERSGKWIGVESHLLAGDLAAYRGNEQRAVAEYRKAAQAGDGMGAFKLGRLLADMGHKSQAQAWLERAVGTAQDNEARLALAGLVLESEPGRTRRLLEALMAVPYQDQPIICRASLLLAKLNRRSGDLLSAGELVDRHLDCAPDSREGWFLAAWLSAAAGWDDLAKEQATKAVRRGWVKAEVLSNEGRRIAENGFAEAASRRYQRAIMLDPSYRPPYEWMARAWRKAGRYCKMLEVERAMRENIGRDADDWLNRFHLQDSLAEKLGRSLAEQGICPQKSHEVPKQPEDSN